MNKEEERNQEIVRMLKTHTLNEVGEFFNRSRQRIFQIAEMYGVDLKDDDRKVGKGSVYRRIDESGLVGTLPDARVATILGTSSQMVKTWRERLGIEECEAQRKPIGCENCETQPYSNGLCRPCYLRDWRRKRKTGN